MLAWHYLVLFSPVLTNDNGDGLSNYLFERQLVLYISLMISFTVIGVVNVLADRRGKRLYQTQNIVYASGAFSVASSALCVVFPVDNTVPFLIAVALLGASEAILMYLWLDSFARRNMDALLPRFAVYMMVGGLLALAICYLKWPATCIVAGIAPGISAAILAEDTKKRFAKDEVGSKTDKDCGDDGVVLSEELAGNQPQSEEKSSAIMSDSHWNRFITLSVCAYALAFGVLQGSFAAEGVTLLMVENPVVLLGIIFAGVLIYHLPDALGRCISVDLMHRYSILLFVFGAILSVWFNYNQVFLIVSQIAILAGFNLFDFGVMAYGIGDKKRNCLSAVHVLEGGRPVVYTFLAIGLVLGYYLLKGVFEGDDSRMLIVVCDAAILMLISTTLIPYYRFNEFAKDGEGEGVSVNLSGAYHNAELAAAGYLFASSSGKQEQTEDWVSPWRSACTQIAKLYQLSPRETEIFFLLAKGRNADFIQQSLVISTHTAKTHIANIYRKLEVHSSQELLDLVEAFRDAERRMAETDDKPSLS